MKNNLPKVFQNPLNKKINNQKECYYSKNNEDRNDNLVKYKIKEILKPSNFIYKKDVVITTSKGSFNKTIIGYTQSKLLTKDNEVIDIKDIIDIKNN